MNSIRANTIAKTALGTALIAVGAFIKIPLPFELSMTMQVFFVILSAFLIGKYSALAAYSYMMIGLIGVPIFTEGGGFMYILKPSFGYIIAFVPSAFIMGKLTEKKHTFKACLLAGIIGIFIIYLIGITYFAFIFKFYLKRAVTAKFIALSLFLAFIWKDILAAVIAAIICVRVRRLAWRQTKN